MIDAGIGIRTLKKTFSYLRAFLETTEGRVDYMDKQIIKAVGSLYQAWDPPVYATELYTTN